MAPKAATRWSGLAPFPNARCKPGLGRCTSRGSVDGIAVVAGCACSQRSCHRISDGRRAWRRCCPGCTSQAARGGIAPRRSRHSWGQRRQGSLRRRSAGANRAGTRHGRRGQVAVFRANSRSLSGWMASTSRPAVRKCVIVAWSFLALTPVATKHWSVCGSAPARANYPGKTCCWTSQVMGWSTGPPWLLGMECWGFGKRCAKGTVSSVGTGVGSIRRPMG